MQSGTILIVDDNKSVLTSLEMLLECEFEHIETAANPNQIVALLDTKDIDLVILDMNFSAGVNTGNEGLFWLSRILEIKPGMPVIMLTAYGDVELAVKALKNGASDFILKPWDNDVLLEKVQTAFTTLNKSRREAKGKAAKEMPYGSNRKSEPGMVIGRSNAMMQLIRLVTKVAKTEANILITGENGTGKEMLAREIHRLSLRSRKEMVSLDMGAISESLFESELFGHEKGAFTDAFESRPGKFEAANGSTLFLDEIGNLSLPLQAKLLAALQNREITRLGSNKKIPVDIRLIAATNRNLPDMVKQGLFREDLFYRINTIQIEIPPLRNRKEDIPVFVNFFLKKYNSLYERNGLSIQPQAIQKLQAYHWPGNIRELQHVIEKAVILAEKNEIRQNDLSIRPSKAAVFTEAASLNDLERQAIETAIRQNDGNLTAAAEQLGVTRQTLYNKLKRFNT
ncbi:sigma-54-dependent transcriptional regulator [Parabacteroides provencensis]|uniref:sigma-54-dependent transcriptional regulator n=1 Tax=Parabacteroides provencensis TaxID=1944636 RepID=UPI000C147840|nr:sigma-54 dependent transcriptional regulator [Parabacteroides provencensis]